MARARPCLVCGRRVDSGESRCELHKVALGNRLRPCMVCGKASPGNYCNVHEPAVDEAERLARQPYRKAYGSWEYQKARQHAYERARGRCQRCGREVGPGDWEADHIVALRDGGPNTAENLAILCKPCHKGKSAATRRARRNLN